MNRATGLQVAGTKGIVMCEVIKTKCAICGLEYTDEFGGKYVPLCSDECADVYANPPKDDERPADEHDDHGDEPFEWNDYGSLNMWAERCYEHDTD